MMMPSSLRRCCKVFSTATLRGPGMVTATLSKNQLITVCFIENVDPMGVHTGDSYCTAPMLTISPELQKKLQMILKLK